MPKISRVPFLILPLFFSLAGCETIQTTVSLMAVKSAGVDQIPKKLAIYPFLSSGGYGGGYTRPKAASAFSAHALGDNVAITPATKTDQAITEDSRMLTDLVSANMVNDGFLLKQLPVETLTDDKTQPSGSPKDFSISVNLLNDLRDNYGIQAIALCDVSFTTVYNGVGTAPEKKVISANVDIVDTKSLDILAQVTLPYVPEGANVNDTAANIAASLAGLANMPVKSKSVSQQ